MPQWQIPLLRSSNLFIYAISVIRGLHRSKQHLAGKAERRNKNIQHLPFTASRLPGKLPLQSSAFHTSIAPPGNFFKRTRYIDPLPPLLIEIIR